MLRFVVVSSPRSGNSWFRSVIASTLNLSELGAHNYQDFPKSLPENCILQIHWPREPNFQSWLRDNGFQVLTVTRHPLDILLSCLNFVKHEPETKRWLEGNTGLPEGLLGAKPNAKQFMDYALSFEFETLLSVTYQWVHHENIVIARYENLVESGEKEFSELLNKIGHSHSVAESLKRFSFDFFKSTSNKHGWMGRSYNYKSFLTPESSALIFQRHENIFKALDYDVEVYSLSDEQASVNWEALKV